MPKPRIMFYNDGRHPLLYMYEPPIQKEEFEAAVDEVVGTPVDALMFGLGDGRTMLHDTKEGELWGHNVDTWSHLIFRRAHQNARELIQRGYDPLRIVCDRAHAKGLMLYPSLLVQQGRAARDQDVRCSEFRFKNTNLEIGASGTLDESFPGLTCLDFKHELVRQERFALIEETLMNYQIDGFELQLNYFPYFFHPDEIESGRSLMTDWIRQVYETVKNSGPERELAIRVPASVQGCWESGLDVSTWMHEGIVDVVIGQTFAGPELLDSTIDFRPLVEAASGAKARIHAVIQSHVDSDRFGEGSIEMIRGAATNYWAQGVDGLYLAHWFGNWPYDPSFYAKLRELPHAEVMSTKDKFYYVPTETGRYSKPSAGPGLTRTLPVPLELDTPISIPFRISDDLCRWDSTGRVHEVLLRVRIMNTTELDDLRFHLNGTVLPDKSLRRINQIYQMQSPRYRTGSGYWFIYHLSRRYWPPQGLNTLGVTLLDRDLDVTPSIYIRDVEFEVKYLMGKHFHHRHELDVGLRDSSHI